MSAAKPTTVIVDRFCYVLDWYEIEKVELDLERTVYEFSYRYGPNWFLEAKVRIGDKWTDVVWKGRGGFNLHNPCAALAALGNRVTKFSTIDAGMHFNNALAELLNTAILIRAQQEEKT